MRSLHRTTVDLILSAVHNKVGEDGMMSSFLYGSKPNAPQWDRHIGTEIFFSLRGITKAALFVRRHGPAYLRALSVEDICGMLRNFLTERRGRAISPATFWPAPPTAA